MSREERPEGKARRLRGLAAAFPGSSTAADKAPTPEVALWIRRFEAGARWTKYAYVLHGVAGTLMLFAWYRFVDNAEVTRLLWQLVDRGVPRVGLLEAIRQCPSPSVWSIALTAVVFATGHVLLLASAIRGWCGAWWSYLQDGDRSPHFGLRLVDWLFWLPAMFALGCAVYWVTYVEMATGRHVICAGTPFNVWLFRMASTSVFPFFVVFVMALPTAAIVRLHFFITRVLRTSRS